MDTLFQPYRLNGTLTLANRFMMAPLTRCMAGPGLVPTAQMAAYYGRRAGIGLIISEATIIRPDGQGYPNTPGIYSPEQIAGWKQVTEAVHAKGGKIFAQLWHVGRLSTPSSIRATCWHRLRSPMKAQCRACANWCIRCPAP